MRYRLTIEYDGTPFVGFQRQKDQISVQGEIERAAAVLNGGPVTLHAAGRTDTGVHALGQVIHFDLVKTRPINAVKNALNSLLQSAQMPVAVLDCAMVNDDFHARFSAIGREYIFRFATRRAPLTFDRNRAWSVARPLDIEAMNIAAKVLLGTHDFTTFRASRCQALSPIKTLDQLDVIATEEGAEMHVAAQSFLHNQVRSFAGALREVGIGKWSADDLRASLDAKDRSACAQVAPPQGLYLSKVIYRDTVDYSPNKIL